MYEGPCYAHDSIALQCLPLFIRLYDESIWCWEACACTIRTIVYIHLQLLMCFGLAQRFHSWCKCLQEIAFFEEGEPMIDGEPGDLKVTNLFVPRVSFRTNTKSDACPEWCHSVQSACCYPAFMQQHVSCRAAYLPETQIQGPLNSAPATVTVALVQRACRMESRFDELLLVQCSSYSALAQTSASCDEAMTYSTMLPSPWLMRCLVSQSRYQQQMSFLFIIIRAVHCLHDLSPLLLLHRLLMMQLASWRTMSTYVLTSSVCADKTS